MAPGFLKNFVKSNHSNHSRERVASESNPRQSGSGFSIPTLARNRSHSTSINSGSGSNATASTNNKKSNKHSSSSTTTSTPTIHVNGATSSRRSVASIDSSVSTQPNFTIVPPSPHPSHVELESDDEEEQEIVVNPSQNSADIVTPRPDHSATEEFEDVVTPTIPKANPFRPQTFTAPTPTPPPATAVEPKAPLKDSSTANMSTSNGTLTPGTYQVRKQPSNKSMLSKKQPPSEISISPPAHVRAATAPAETSPQQEPPNGAGMKAITESPTEITFPSNPVHGQSRSEYSSVTSPIQRENTAASVISPDGSKTKRPWKRSNTRKPTGLASAIAASGVMMANPTLSAERAAQLASPPLPIPSANSSKSNPSASGSPPYLSKSPAQSTVSHRSGHGKVKSVDLSPKSSRAKKSNGRPRRASAATSAKSDGSEYYPSPSASATLPSAVGDDIRPDYYSGLELDDDTDESDDEGSDLTGEGSDLDGEDLHDMPVTGFAVASNKRNADFHELFPSVPEGDYLIEDYGCALQREILIQGRLYISENHICFHANIFGWITDLSVPIYEITNLEKKMTAFVIPNAIQITTRQAKYSFASFLSRDTTFDVIYNIWRLARPSEDGGSFISSGRGSLDGPVQGGGVSGAGGVLAATAILATPVRKATQCTCGKEGKHFPETAMEVVIPGTPEKIYNLMFASGFMKDFMSENQKLLEIQMSDWAPVAPGSKLLTRNMSYIKPLSGSLGPKQTKCEIKDETAHCDFEDYVSTITTTRTPEVPSGGVFSVKTRTCIMWANPVSSKVIVTTQVEWTGRSFIKGIIERSAIDGQKVYHSDLENAMRAYIQQHQSEFLPEGVEAVAAVAVADEAEAVGAATGVEEVGVKHPTPEEQKQRERERNQRSLQWAWDTFDGAYQVGKRSAKGALELIRDAWDQSSSTTILWFVIIFLVLSNVWTLMRAGSGKAESKKKIEAKKVEDRERWVQSIVTALWDELAAGKVATPTISPTLNTAIVPTPPPVEEVVIPAPPIEQIVLQPPNLTDWKDEVKRLQEALDTVEERVKAIRESLSGLQKHTTEPDIRTETKKIDALD